jgi:hypothetical protein
MPPEKKDMDEPVNVDMEPEDTLRVLLGEERREATDETEDSEDNAEE